MTVSTQASSISDGGISANSVRISASACPPTFSRVAGPEGVVERVLARVDEEVDRLGLGHAEQRRRLLDGPLADLERPLPERVVALVPVDPDDRRRAASASRTARPRRRASSSGPVTAAAGSPTGEIRQAAADRRVRQDVPLVGDRAACSVSVQRARSRSAGRPR